MPSSIGPNTVEDGLIFAYDLADTKNSFKGEPVSNFIPSSVGLGRYNNPGFAGENINTGELHFKHKTPIWKLTHIAQDEGRVPRLSSGEGYGCHHTMNTRLEAGQAYLASISFKPDPNSPVRFNHFNHGYSNIGGWNHNGTTRTMVYEGRGWYRMYTIFQNGTTSRSSTGEMLSTRYASNVYTTVTLGAGEHIVEGNSFNPAQYVGNDHYRGTYDIGASVQNDYDGAGVTIVDFGIDPDMTKPTYDPVYNYPNPNFSLKVFYKVQMNNPGQIRLRSWTYGVFTSLADNKYWKINFDPDYVELNKEMTTYWSAPMIREIPSNNYRKPTKYVEGSRSTTESLKPLVGDAVLNLNNISFNDKARPTFDGTDDLIVINDETVRNLSRDVTLSSWFKWDNSAYAPHRTLICTDTNYRAGVKLMAFYHGNMACWIGNNDGTDSYLVAGTPPPANEWHMLSCTRSISGEVKLFLDGELIKQEDTGIVGDIHKANHGMVGAEYHSKYMGELDMGRIYDRVLSEDEIRKLYQTTKSRFQ